MFQVEEYDGNASVTFKFRGVTIGIPTIEEALEIAMRAILLSGKVIVRQDTDNPYDDGIRYRLENIKHGY